MSTPLPLPPHSHPRLIMPEVVWIQFNPESALALAGVLADTVILGHHLTPHVIVMSRGTFEWDMKGPVGTKDDDWSRWLRYSSPDYISQLDRGEGVHFLGLTFIVDDRVEQRVVWCESYDGSFSRGYPAGDGGEHSGDRYLDMSSGTLFGFLGEKDEDRSSGLLERLGLL